MAILCSADIIEQKEVPLEYGNRLNALFMEEIIPSGESMRRLIHYCYPSMVPTLEAFYEYYLDHDHKKLCEKIKEIEKLGIRCSFKVTKDKIGRDILQDNFRNGESKWADWKLYQEKYTLIVCDEAGNNVCKKFDQKSVFDVLQDTLKNGVYSVEPPEKTGNAELDLLLSYMYNNYEKVQNIWDYHGSNVEWNNQAYLKALKLINTDIISAFSKHKNLEPETAYIKAIVMMEDLSPRVFHAIDYRLQRTFYRSELAHELLKFSHLTTTKTTEFNAEKLDKFIQSVGNSGGWQEAQYKITKEYLKERHIYSVLNNCILDLNAIRPLPKERMYFGYYRDDVRRGNYLNLYLNKFNDRNY